MLSEKIEHALSAQIRIEAESSQIYLAMACWAEHRGLEGVSQFMYRQSDEERQHMLKLIKFVNERGGLAHISELKAPNVSFSSFKEMFQELFVMKCSFQKALTTLFTLHFKNRIMQLTISFNGM